MKKIGQFEGYTVIGILWCHEQRKFKFVWTTNWSENLLWLLTVLHNVVFFWTSFLSFRIFFKDIEMYHSCSLLIENILLSNKFFMTFLLKSLWIKLNIEYLVEASSLFNFYVLLNWIIKLDKNSSFFQTTESWMWKWSHCHVIFYIFNRLVLFFCSTFFSTLFKLHQLFKFQLWILFLFVLSLIWFSLHQCLK